MAEPKLNTRYKCHRTGLISFEPSINGALMVKIPYASFDEDPIEGVYSCCIGAKDGTMQENTIKNLMDIFKVEELIDLTTLPVPETPTHEFDLSEWEAKEKYPGFKWLNAPREEASQDSILEKWGGKLALFSRKAATAEVEKPAAKTKPAKAEKPVEKPVEKPAEKATVPKRGVPAKSAARTFPNGDAVFDLLTAKHPGKDADELANELFYPATDEILGKDVTEGTPEQWGKVADKLGV